MTIVAGDVVRVAGRMTVSPFGDEQVCVLHIRHTSGPALTDALASTTIRDALTTLYANVNSVIQTSVLKNIIDMQRVDPTPLTLASQAWGAGFAPAAGGQMLPIQTSALVLGQTTTPRVQGRKFLFPFSELNNNNGTIDAPGLTAMANFGANWIAQFILAGVTWDWGVFRSLPARFLVFSATTAIDVLRTQRRRTPGVGA